MAWFIGIVKGQKGEASRMDAPKSGIETHAAGWNSGVLVQGNNVAGFDRFNIYMTDGSKKRGLSKLLGRVDVDIDGTITFTPK